MRYKLWQLWHILTHEHWSMESGDVLGGPVVLEICVSRTWRPWLLDTDRMSVGVIPPHGDTMVVGKLSLDQVKVLMNLPTLDFMRVFLMENGNGTIAPQ